MANLATQLRNKYNVDVFACGDYNASESTTEYKTFLSEAGFVDAKTDAKVKNRACKTYHTLFKDVSTSTYESIDHITFATETASKVLYYNTLINDYVIDASDHCPIYIDIKTKKLFYAASCFGCCFLLHIHQLISLIFDAMLGNINVERRMKNENI